ncbi:MAG TPA: hypothetical protein VFA34_08025 [Actinomycetota bacterium]|jgi:hypothetical protein|nr:hypothetical protein [Actinomycetota bacterium]
MSRPIRLVLAIALVAGFASCSSNEPQASRPSSSATVEIIEPQPNAVVSGDTIDIRVKLTGGRVVKEVSRNLNETEGHLHVSVDGAILSQTYGLSQEIDAPKPGKHLLQVEFVAKDHGPFEPRVLTSSPFEVKR